MLQQSKRSSFKEFRIRDLSEIIYNELVFLMSVSNARMGKLFKVYEHVMRRHEMVVENENGDILIETCSNHKLMIGGSMFSHKERHKMKWTAPNPALSK